METNLGTIYVLYGGTSCDGRGNPTYVGRTTDMKEAREHLKKGQSNPYSIGSVWAMTDTEFHMIRESCEMED